MRVAIVHDFLNQMGGAERVVETLSRVFPEATVFSSFYLPTETFPALKDVDIRTSFMQKLPALKRHFRKYLLLYPIAFERFDMSAYDVVISSSSAWAKAVKTPLETCHISYCYTPMRFAWDYDKYVEKEQFGPLIRTMLPFFVKRLKEWDVATVGRVDHFVAISHHIAKRIENCYGRKAEVIYPPVNTSHLSIAEDTGDYFIVVSRLNAYKRIDLAIDAFNRLGYPLKIIGKGPQKEVLEDMAGPNIEFLSGLPDEILASYYARCKALIFPSEEDFGIAPVEAMASGRPVIAYAKGGALETVINGKTGLFFYEQTSEAIVEAVKKFESMSFDPISIREHALEFDQEIFENRIRYFVEEKYQGHRQKLKLQGRLK